MIINRKPKEGIRKRKNQYAFLVFPYVIILILFVVAPLFLVIYRSFIDLSGALTFDNYIKFITDNFIKALLVSLKYASISTILCVIIGFPIAYIISRSKKRYRGYLLLLITAPMWINMLLKIRAWQTILNDSILGTDAAVIIGIIYVYIPFMIIPIYSVLNKMDERLLEASFDLGANRFQTFIRVVLPLSIPGVLSGVIMVLLPSATMYVIPNLLGRRGYNTTIGELIEQQFLRGGSKNYGSAIAVIISITMILLLYITKKAGKYNDKE